MGDAPTGKLMPYAMWTKDCQGKLDYDGSIISVSTRYWPDHTARSSIILQVGPREEHDGGGDYFVWRGKEFSAGDEATVKEMVESWIAQQVAEVVALLGGRKEFRFV